ncbi:DNA-binding GntR family transcriptional regulator [Thermocatellispora tengchongensis]|uniref:DNA-binding GntR family transcriptional regulator n=1 Tax=Thermocatellispora tengchongensis TaxID=1073253 RepID=A0A840PBU2_9ACTN|nr:GntR family transcriptional regulator [Thermocatellispora tengchongensis]MBB5136722.1 DNA-binding GntR family transcriptional regulator [Thermocatellispora tengchongensis]
MPPGSDGRSSVASQRIADTLRKRILSGDLAPGARIMQEDVAASLGSSRLPVREALRILEAEGLVVLKPNSGAWVSKMDLVECQAIYKLRERVEPLALSESMPNLTSDDIARLDEIQQEIETNRDVDRFLSLDREFHLITYSGCGIDQLLAMVRRFWNTTQHYRRAYANLIDPTGHELINFEHRLIIEAIKRGDSTDAERFLAGHIRRTRLALSRHPELFTQ